MAKIILDITKASHVKFHWRCDSSGASHFRSTKPQNYTVNGAEFDCLAQRSLSVNETMLEYAQRRQLLDYWYAECIFHLYNKPMVIYIGEKAEEMYKVWCAHVFGKKKEKK